MATVSSVLPVIRASHPNFGNPNDKMAFAVHASFLAAGYSLIATGSHACSDNPPTEINPIPSLRLSIDRGSPPTLKLAHIRAAIPKHYWVKNLWRSMSYVVGDVAIVSGFAVAAAYIKSWIVWPLYWIAQGTIFWAMSVDMVAF